MPPHVGHGVSISRPEPRHCGHVCAIENKPWLTAICPVPGGAWPSYAHDYSKRDNVFYGEWDAIARDRDTFRAWMDEHVMTASAVGGDR